jgi:hypothetical protein
MLKQAKLPMSTAGNVELCIPGQKASIEEIHARQQTAGRKNAMAENERSCSTEALSCPVKERGKVKFPKKAENHFSLLDDDDTSETEEVEAQEFKTLNSADECWSDSDGEESDGLRPTTPEVTLVILDARSGKLLCAGRICVVNVE